VLARIETALFAAPGFTPVHAVSELAMHPHVRFSGIPLDAPLRLVSGQETVDVKVNTVFRANTSEALRRRWSPASVSAACSSAGGQGFAIRQAGAGITRLAITRSLPLCRLSRRPLYPSKGQKHHQRD
jgi:hypothetical protein